jgi:hypothetical protein
VSKVQIQFHADPAEAISLGLQWASDYGLTPVIEWFFPEYRAALASEDDIARDAGIGDISRLALCKRAPDLSVPTAHEFTKRNPDCLYLSIGRREKDTLRESALGGSTDDAETKRLWKAVVRDARSIMHTGAVVRDPGSRAAQHMSRHLHTSGAHILAEQRVRMLPAAGWTEFEFLDCQDQASADDVSSSQ